MKASSNDPFIDQLTINIASGHGGAGSSSFRREYRAPRGGPDGGDGGRGGDLYIVGDSRKHTLLDYRYKRTYKANDGEHGRGAKCSGKHGQDAFLPVPLGTQVIDAKTNKLIVDVIEEKPYKVLEGGKGGLGNWHFRNSKNQAPEYSQSGLPGEELHVQLELKLIADVGLIGFPNAGKSTLLTVLSNAKTKVGAYPFTTLNPQLGVMKHKEQEIVLADLPGLIEGASEGVGLGHKFLRHTERTKNLLHLISLDPSEAEEPIDRYKKIRIELKNYSKGMVPLEKLNETIILTKLDLCSNEVAEKNVQLFSEFANKVFVISSLTHRNLDTLKDELINVNEERFEDV